MLTLKLKPTQSPSELGINVYMSYSPNSLKGNINGIIQGTTIGLSKGDARSLDYSSYVCNCAYVSSGSKCYSPYYRTPANRDILFLEILCAKVFMGSYLK